MSGRCAVSGGKDRRVLLLLDDVLMSLYLEDTGHTINGRAIWRLRKNLVHRIPKYLRVVVPVGFETDLASTPRVFQAVFPSSGEYRVAAVIHDWLYTKEANCSRFLADAIFYSLMLQFGVKTWKATCLYYGVRLGGWKYYQRR